jgi:ribonuclease P protein component
VVGRKFGRAHLRNAWKRRFREAFRTNRDRLPAGHDFVVLPRAPGVVPDECAATESLIRTAQAAARFYEKRGPKK